MAVALTVGLASGLPASWLAGSIAGQRVALERSPIQLGEDGAMPGVRLVGILRGLDAAARQQMKAAPWPDVFRIRVAGRLDDTASTSLPTVRGTYRLDQDDVVFTPRFPFKPGLRLHAFFHPRPLGPFLSDTPGSDFSEAFEVRLKVAAGRVLPRAAVSQVYPTASSLPENLLKLYLHFSHPMAAGVAYQHVHLLDESGKEVELPFLELEQELWDRRQRRLTLFFDPGRIKRGLLPNERVGSPLQRGERYQLRVDASWPDADGIPLKQGFQKFFGVVAPDRQPPDPQDWDLGVPLAATSHPLIVRFPEPLDQALLERLISVVGPGQTPMAGRVTVSDEERLWEFVPETPWKPGDHRLAIGTVLEDLAGNALSAPFEVDVFETVQERLTVSVYHLEFRVKE